MLWQGRRERMRKHVLSIAVKCNSSISFYLGNLKGHGVKEIRRSSPRQLSMKDNPKSGPDSDESKKLLKLIMEDQNIQKQDMAKTFFTFMKRKIAEYDRQLAEGADSASVTKEENDHFKKTFCDCCEGSKMQKFNKRCRIL